MKRINSFTFITLNGFFKGNNEDISWHRHGEEENKYASDNLGSGSILLFGRKTYQMMASYWPTPEALKNDPEVAKGMNSAEKIVFSNSLKKPVWENSRIVSGNIVEQVKQLKEKGEKDMTILGSGSIVALFAGNGLIDEYQLMVDPVALPEGTAIFKGLTKKLDLRLTKSKTFKSGVVLMCYEPL